MLTHPAFKQVAHRPYPLPKKPWALSMSWSDLSFMHWPVSPESLRPQIPEALELDTFDGTAWLGIVPFSMRDTRPRFLPAVTGLSDFLELNVRTYVSHNNKAGVWFFSLDAANPIAVRLARRGFYLPYFDAQMSSQIEGTNYQYESVRNHKNAPAACFQGSYQPLGEVYHTKPGTLESFLTERYAFYSANSQGDIFRGDIHHQPWPLQKAQATIARNSLTEHITTLPDTEPLVHFVKHIEVAAWLPVNLSHSSASSGLVE